MEVVSAVSRRANQTTYTSKPEVTEDTSALSSHNAPVLDLCEPCVAVHLGELELSLCAHSLR